MMHHYAKNTIPSPLSSNFSSSPNSSNYVITSGPEKVKNSELKQYRYESKNHNQSILHQEKPPSAIKRIIHPSIRVALISVGIITVGCMTFVLFQNDYILDKLQYDVQRIFELNANTLEMDDPAGSYDASNEILMDILQSDQDKESQDRRELSFMKKTINGESNELLLDKEKEDSYQQTNTNDPSMNNTTDTAAKRLSSMNNTSDAMATMKNDKTDASKTNIMTVNMANNATHSAKTNPTLGNNATTEVEKLNITTIRGIRMKNNTTSADKRTTESDTIEGLKPNFKRLIHAFVNKENTTKGSIIINSNTNQTDDSERLFVGNLHNQDVYSGMWYQSMESFLLVNASRIRSLEAATYTSTSDGRFQTKRVRMTNNMLDWGVEHLSIFFRNLHFEVFLPDKQLAYQKCLDSLQNYTNRTIRERLIRHYQQQRRLQKSDSGVEVDDVYNATLAIIPYGYTSKNDVIYNLQKESLLATLASLYQVGIGRIVIMGGIDDEEKNQTIQHMTYFEQVIKDEISEIQKMHSDQVSQLSFELVFIDAREYEQNKFLPKSMIVSLQNVLVQNTALYDKETLKIETFKWLGTNDLTKWKYLYFTEPDLILHTRQATRYKIGQAMKNHNYILMAHRFQLVQHESDFPVHTIKYPKLIMPAVGRYKNVTIVNETHECIWNDKQNDKAALKNRTCKTFWFLCGYGMDSVNVSSVRVVNDANSSLVTAAEHSFRMFEPFQLMRLQHGTQFAMITGTQTRNICQLQ